MINKTKIGIIALISVVSVLPLTKALTNLFSQQREISALSGVESYSSDTELNWQNLISQKFQHAFETKYQRLSGISSFLIRTDNQLSYSGFNQASSNPKGNVLLGNNDHLIERLYLRDANRTMKAPPQKLSETATLLSKFQKYLANKKIGFLLVISPNKPSFYPESVPMRLRVPGYEDRFSQLQFFIQELSKLGVNFVSTSELLKAQEKAFAYPMFPTTGTHWSELGGCLAAKEIMVRAQNVLGKPIRQFDCRIEGERDRPVYQDADLLRLANLWFPNSLNRPAPKIKRVRTSTDDALRPRILIVGSSFCWELLRNFEKVNATTDNDFLYYFKRHFKFSGGKGKSIDRSRIDLDKLLSSKDLVVIEINQAFLKKTGFGFMEASVAQNEHTEVR